MPMFEFDVYRFELDDFRTTWENFELLTYAVEPMRD
ncbi:hypothetical protein SacN8_10800 [Sulfolobus acidocaldarius N8]|uniref:Uncharacterized protein n=1 Tax=Sulfolobus acidocaldarius N8 TaxID=1028566 RepID=M1IYK9_9CREN|nr:hypothetical protein SacN8_10800 [Sulfolobus acidocaldarius N8]